MPKMLVLMIQREVADRILERDGKSSRLSIFVNYFGKPELVAKVPAGAFYPPPKVDSVIIRVKTHGGKFADNQKMEKEFFEFVRLGFAHPRKKLISNLNPVRGHPAKGTATATSGRPASNMVNTKFIQRLFAKQGAEFIQEKLREVFGKLNLNPNARAEDLNLEDWQNLFENL